MDEEEFEVYVEEAEPAFVGGRRFSWLDPLVLGLQVATGIGEAVTQGINDLGRVLVMHIDHENDRKEFAAEAARELESILEPGE